MANDVIRGKGSNLGPVVLTFEPVETFYSAELASTYVKGCSYCLRKTAKHEALRRMLHKWHATGKVVLHGEPPVETFAGE